MTGLPVSRLIRVGVNLTPPLASFPNFNTLLILGTSSVIDVVTRIQSYGDIDEVAAAFGTSAPEYKAAALWFEQAPKPTTLVIGRWANAPTPGQLFGGPLSAPNLLPATWAAITNGSVHVAVDGGGPQSLTALNFTGVNNLNAVATVINGELTGAICTFDALNERFVITSNTTGAASSVSFATAGTGGTDISDMLAMRSTDSGAFVANGIVAETALAAVTLFVNKYAALWYGLVITAPSDADVLAVAQFVEATDPPHVFGVTTQAAATLVTGDTTSLAYQLKQLNLNHTAVQYSSVTPYAAASLLGRILTTNWSGNSTVITLMYKQEPGIAGENLSTSQADALEAVNCNVFAEYNNDTAIIQYGAASSGQFLDTVIGTDWLRAAIQNNVYDLLFGSTTKIPQTDAGNHQIGTAIVAACVQGVANGLLAPGVWNAAGFGSISQGDFLDKGYYVYQPPIASQSPADRAARKSVPFQVAAKLAGAVHTVDVLVNVNS